MAKRERNEHGYKLPLVIEPDENCCICIPIPNDYNHKMAFLGQLDELGYWWNWERDTDKKGREAAAVWRKIVACIREDMNMSDCGCGDDKITNSRINPDTGIYEVSTDGGITWEPAPWLDPRSSGTTFPPVPGDPGAELRCKAANSVVGWTQELQEQELQGLNDNATVAEFVTLVLAALAAVGLAFALVPTAIAALLYFVINTFARAIPSEFESHFTEATWDTLNCVIYCSVEDDGSFTEAGWQEAKSQSLALIGGYAGQWIFDHFNLIGTVGLTNAARANYDGTRECDDCECIPTCEDPDRFTLGTVVGQGVTPEGNPYFDVESAPNGVDGADTVIWGTMGALSTACCTWLDTAFIVGSCTGSTGRYVTFTGTSEQVPFESAAPAENISAMAVQQNGCLFGHPFTVRITFSACTEE